ncbi:MAG: hemerythrin domain-containing protein, partial [Deltaproteobacteria bacterium]|nr:hemerythrin domain-containing protein [Kofleriaceae bacterium]
MLSQIGKQPAREGGELVTALSECHERIRLYLNLARQLAAATDVTARERRDAARAVRRYFSLALPLHIADEEELITPLLVGSDPHLDEALRMMNDEHDEHDHDVQRLVLLCHVLEHDPSHRRARAELAKLAARLDAAFARHLALEEAIVFPALR